MRRRRSMFKLVSALVCTCVIATIIVASYGTPQEEEVDKPEKNQPVEVVVVPVNNDYKKTEGWLYMYDSAS